MFNVLAARGRKAAEALVDNDAEGGMVEIDDNEAFYWAKRTEDPGGVEPWCD